MLMVQSKPSILPSKVRLSRLDQTRPLWIRAASGTANTLAVLPAQNCFGFHSQQ